MSGPIYYEKKPVVVEFSERLGNYFTDNYRHYPSFDLTINLDMQDNRLVFSYGGEFYPATDSGKMNEDIISMLNKAKARMRDFLGPFGYFPKV